MAPYSSSYYHYREPVLDWGAFYIITTLSSYLFLFLIACCIACGISFLAELCEEHSTATKRVLKLSIPGFILCHLLIALVDGLSWWRSLLSVATLLSYTQLLKTFPWVVLSSPAVIASVVLCVLDTLSWYSYFYGAQGEYPFSSIAAFFALLVWSMPAGLVVSVAVAEEQWLGSELPRGGGGGRAELDGVSKKRRSVVAIVKDLVARVL